MRYVRMSLKKEEYEALKGCSYKEVSDWVKGHLGADILCGYGYYGCSMPVAEDGGGYFIEYSRGDSCD